MNRRALAVLVSTSCLMLVLVQRAAGAITYISAERFVQITATSPFVREDAVGFNDFDASHTRFVSGGGAPVIRVSASQQSFLRSDRIDVATAAYTGEGLLNSGAVSNLRVTFSVDVATPFTLYTGPIFHESLEGTAVAALNAGTSTMSPYIAVFGTQSPPASGVLIPGVYTFTVQATAGRLQNITGQSTAIASLVVPAPASIALLLCGAGVRLRRRIAL